MLNGHRTLGGTDRGQLLEAYRKLVINAVFLCQKEKGMWLCSAVSKLLCVQKYFEGQVLRASLANNNFAIFAIIPWH